MNPKTKYWFSLKYNKVVVSDIRPRGRYRHATYEEVNLYLIDEQFKSINGYKKNGDKLRLKS